MNSRHFGVSELDSAHALGRTLTHEVGHYLGLLHPWGARVCIDNDYCDDTPPVDEPVLRCPSVPVLGCADKPIMADNYMNYVEDACMNTFTRDQAAGARYVLENEIRQRSQCAP